MGQLFNLFSFLTLIWFQISKPIAALPHLPWERFGSRRAANASFRTVFPLNPGPLAVPQTQGIYPTSLEHDGHPFLPPFPTVTAYGASRPSVGNFSSSQALNSSSGFASLEAFGIPKTVTVTVTIMTSPNIGAQNMSPMEPSPDLLNTEHPNTPGVEERRTSIDFTPDSTASMIPAPRQAPPTSNMTPNSSPAIGGQDVFLPLSLGPIPGNITSRADHPVPKQGIVNFTGPVETNKFYAGFFLGSRTTPTFTHPYSLVWAQGSGGAQSWGISISNIDADQIAFGPPNPQLPGSPVSNYINPIGIQSIILSAAELSNGTVLNIEQPTAFSAKVILLPQTGLNRSVTFPVLQGMGFVTGIYSNLQPIIQSTILFQDAVIAGSPRPGVFKYRVLLMDGKNWLVYVTPDNGIDPSLSLDMNSVLRGPPGFSGTIQVAKNPLGDVGEQYYDNSSGVYPVAANVSGSVSNSTGIYSLSWQKAGKDADSTPLLMFALPHHVESFDDNTKSRQVPLQLRTTTKGNATGVTGESWTMIEPNLPINMGFAPWSPSNGSVTTLSPAAQQFINSVAPIELQQNVDAETNLDSIYFSGKALNKFAAIVYTLNNLTNETGPAASTLEALKSAFARFVNNQQIWPLAYDSVWGGVVSTSTYVTGDSGVDFGNTYYNDHHFHYGYFILTAAIIGSIDPSWIPGNQAWVNMLVRDAGNSVANDTLFPFSRSFDWFHGHSWAKGLFESSDGKDEESTSEDAMFAYALKMWGNTIGDRSLEARGNLMLGINRRSLNSYFLLQDNNTNQPPQFIPNKVTGILFENKVDHTTYFGTNLEYIDGIHILPILPSTAYTRMKEFVREEWNAVFSPNASTPAQNVVAGWKGVLYSNLALIDPGASWAFFSQPNFDYSWIDGGASRIWYLAYAAGLS